jgi:hypothetical protein
MRALHTQPQTKGEPYVFTAKLEGHDTGYEIFVNYSDSATKITSKRGIAIYLPSKLIEINIIGEIYFVNVPRWIYNKYYGFFNS